MSAAAQKTPADVRASAPPPAPPEGEPLTAPARFEMIAVDLIEPSATNFRKAFDEGALQELADSILIKGVVEPVIVRPRPAWRPAPTKCSVAGKWELYCAETDTTEHTHFDTKAEAQRECDRRKYELVAGERRWRATKLAGLKTIPAIVREYSDRAALEVQIIENDQRADLSPMERAAGFRMMQDRLGYSADEIARKLHKSKTFVYSHLKLAQLPKVAAEALERGPENNGISRSVAELIARIPDEKTRELAAKQLVTGYANSGPMTYREARAYVERMFMKELKGAPFKLDDSQLLPAAGPCTTCQHCTANTPEQYQGKRTDMCLMPSCFQKKVEAHHTAALAKFREAGHTVVQASEAREMFKSSDHYISGGNSKYALLSDTHWESGKSRTYRQILGKSYKAIVAQTPRGAVVELCLKADVRKAIEASKPKGAKGEKATGRLTERRDPERELMDAALAEAAGKLVERVEANGTTFPLPLMRILVSQHLEISSELDRIAARRGVKCKQYEEEKAFAEIVPKMAFPKLVGLLVEMCFFEPYMPMSTKLHDDQVVLLKLFNVDFEKVKAAVKKRRDDEQRKAKQAAQPPAAKSPAKKTARAAAGRGR
jgi:ParB/RepB/Spo0J family partition protein